MAAENLLPERIVASPARRTRETLSLLADGARKDLLTRTEWVDALYHSTLETLLGVLTNRGDWPELMVLGHNPGLEELLDYLVKARPKAPKFSKRMPTGALYVLEIPGGLDELKPGCASVLLHQRPKALAD